MGSLGSAGTRRFLCVLAVSALAVGAVATWALAAGSGGWERLGVGPGGIRSLDLAASALAVAPGAVYVGGNFTGAGGVPYTNRIAKWNGTSWSAISTLTSQISNGGVSAIAVSGNRVFAGGTFTGAGGDANADFLAVWNGTSWAPFCNSTGPPTAFNGNVTSLQIVGPKLYVGGSFQNAAGIPEADYLVACDLASGAASATVIDEAHAFSGSVYALAAGGDDTLYAGGLFTNLESIPAADNVAYLPAGGSWQPMGAGGGLCSCAVTGAVRGLAVVGTDAYIGTDANDIDGIPEADHVAKWNGSAWSPLGAGSGVNSGNGWFPAVTSINALTSDGSHLFVTGSFQNANADARADNIAFFDGTVWRPVGSDGAGNGPWNGTGLAVAVLDRQLYATGSFTSAGGDDHAQFAASFGLSQVIAYPTPTVTPGPGPVPTPTVTPSPNPPPDTTPPATKLRRAQLNQAIGNATFAFASAEQGSTFACKLDTRSLRPCASPKTYKKLDPGKHVFRVRARDRAGNRDRTPVVKRFTIKRR